MKKLSKFMKSKLAKIFAILFVSIALVLVSAPVIDAGGPIFNGLPGDQEMLRGANSTQNPGSAVWADPVSGKHGEAIAVLVYYHNIVEGTTARNTRISVTLPQGESTVHVLNGKLWAANADAVRDTLTINSQGTTRVEYIPGTTKLFANRQGDPTGEGQALPDGVTTPQGVNIGSIQGCWPYAGYVLFQVRLLHEPIPTPTNPNIAIEKNVSNIIHDNGNFNWQEIVEANRGEDVAFRLLIKNTGDTQLTNVVIKDVLPQELNFLSSAAGEGLVGAGVNLGNLEVGGQKEIIFRAKIKHTLPNNAITIINKAMVTADGGLKDEDTATVKVPFHFIKREKKAFNITRGIDAQTQPARPGDIIEYYLITTNTGTGARNNFVTEDDLSNVLDNAKIISIADGGTINGNTIVYPAIDLKADKTIKRSFKIKVESQAKGSDFEMKNVYGNEVIILIEKPKPPIVQNPLLSIDKLVRNISRGENSFVKENYTYPAEVLEYRIEIRNNGDAQASNVKLRDVLPIPVSYVGGTIKIILADGTVITNPQLFNSDMAAGNLRPYSTSGNKIIVTFQAKVNSEIAAGSRFENKAVATADGGLRDTSFAYTNVVSKEVPSPTPTPEVKGVMVKGLTPTGVNAYVIILLALAFAIGAGAVMSKVAKS